MTFTFEERLQLLDEYVEKYHEYPAFKEEYKGFNLGNWIMTLRMTYNHGELQENGDILYETKRLKKEEITILKKHNFYFSDFDMYVSLLKEFINEYGRYPKLKEIYKGKDIGTWTVKTRTIYNNGIKDEEGNIRYKTFKLTKKQVEQLIKMKFMFKKEFIPAWNNNFKLLKEFINEYKRFPKNGEKYKGKCLGAWCSNQKTNFSHGREIKKDVFKYKCNSATTKEQFIELIDIGFPIVREKEKYFNETIDTKEKLLNKKRYLLLHLESILKKQNNEILTKEDTKKIEQEFKKIFTI